VGMRHKYLLRHPVMLYPNVKEIGPRCRARARERAEQERKTSQATVYVVRDGRAHAVASR